MKPAFNLPVGLRLCLLLMATAPRVGRGAEDSGKTFEAGNLLYEKGNYREAAKAYEAIAQSGRVSPVLYFNLGNAWFKTGQIGRAIFNYRLAEQLAPRDPDVRANLQFARESVENGAGRKRDLLREWTNRLTLNEWAALLTAVNWGWFSLLLAGQFRPAWKPALSGPIRVGALLGVATVAGFGVVWHDRLQVNQVVVVAREAIVRYGPFEEAQSFFAVGDGCELRVLQRKDEWLEVSDRTHGSGWLQRKQVIELPALGG